MFCLWDHLVAMRSKKEKNILSVCIVSIDFPCLVWMFMDKSFIAILHLPSSIFLKKKLHLPNLIHSGSCYSIRLQWNQSFDTSWRVPIVQRPKFMNNKVRKSWEKKSRENKKLNGVESTIFRFIGYAR